MEGAQWLAATGTNNNSKHSTITTKSAVAPGHTDILARVLVAISLKTYPSRGNSSSLASTLTHTLTGRIFSSPPRPIPDNTYSFVITQHVCTDTSSALGTRLWASRNPQDAVNCSSQTRGFTLEHAHTHTYIHSVTTINFKSSVWRYLHGLRCCGMVGHSLKQIL